MSLPPDLAARPIAARVRALLDLLSAGGDADYIGEPVSQLQHALQAAASGARTGDDELVLAALFHDLGHLADPAAPSMEGLGTVDHQGIGRRRARDVGFSERVAELIGGHVDAKRYQVARRDGYRERLSPASARTLELQGGPMNDTEAAAFQQRADFADVLAVRAWDEAAKDPDADVPGVDSYEPMLRSHLERVEAGVILSGLDRELTEAELDDWRRGHCLVLPGVLAGQALDRLTQWVEDFQERPETAGKWMKYFEQADDRRQLCRIEDVLPHHAGFLELLAGPVLLRMLATLMGESAVLFKEKINLKLPGGAGFQAHQDAPAFTTFGQTYHVTVLVTVDEADERNGCLEFADPLPVGTLLPQDAGGAVHPDTEDSLAWHALPLPAGSVVFFDSWIPHRSAPNRSERPRRGLYVTYNRASEGERRDEYFADKRRVFPPEVEREAGVDYSTTAGQYNVGNPIR